MRKYLFRKKIKEFVSAKHRLNAEGFIEVPKMRHAVKQYNFLDDAGSKMFLFEKPLL